MDDAIKTILNADGALTGLLTGGIYTRNELKEPGLNARTAPNAFDTDTTLIKPCAVIVVRESNPDNQIADTGAQKISVNEAVLIYLYDDGTTNRSIIESAESRIKTLLFGKQINSKILLYQGNLKDRERDMRNAHLIRAKYSTHGVI